MCVFVHSLRRPTGLATVRQSPRQRRRLDYAALDVGEPDAATTGAAAGAGKYPALLAARTFPPAQFTVLRGEDVTLQRMQTLGFGEPLFVPDAYGLGMCMPDASFTVDDVVELVGTASAHV